MQGRNFSVFSRNAWRRRPSARVQADADLTIRMRAVHADSRGTYGAPRIHAELSAAGAAVSRKRVARVMRSAGIAGVSRRRGPRTTRRALRVRPAPDRVDRRFEAAAPNRLWVADITCIPTRAGFLYLAVVVDVFSRRVVGWAMAAHLRTARVRVHRRVEQHAAASFRAGLPLAAGLRTSPRDGAGVAAGNTEEGMMAHRRRVSSARPASRSPVCPHRAPYPRRALWTCPAYGRPVRVVLHPQVGDTGAHSPLEISRATAEDRAGAEAARFPQVHSAFLSTYSHGKPRHDLNPNASTCPQNRGNLNLTAKQCQWPRGRGEDDDEGRVQHSRFPRGAGCSADR